MTHTEFYRTEVAERISIRRRFFQLCVLRQFLKIRLSMQLAEAPQEVCSLFLIKPPHQMLRISRIIMSQTVFEYRW
ncbi:hypothetical protein Fuma_00576 [Fuerstiella marisgermanici]|uniref:Uncharacterized protein n=1 Tax=Fuerstiella marisgermanici TaxID=1891926 RepID=A0A1P8WAA5_9PLAN|nr:hypothetical protein Fuma_00576 [Fuerstiella marisgermanici]